MTPSVYHEGIEDMLAEERDYERELAAERLERLERLDGYVPASGIWYGADVIARASSTSPAASGAGVPRGRNPRGDSPTDTRGCPSSPSPVEVPSQGQPRRDVGDESKEAA